MMTCVVPARFSSDGLVSVPIARSYNLRPTSSLNSYELRGATLVAAASEAREAEVAAAEVAAAGAGDCLPLPLPLPLPPLSRSQKKGKGKGRGGDDSEEDAPAPLPLPSKKGGKRSIRPTVSDVIAANSRITLRESPGRFYMPHASGVKHEYRQKVLCEAGVTQPQYSYVLQPGKAENLSAGVEDNFSRSQYPSSQPTDPGYKRLDLPDMCAPGKYTPRKQPGHPSANPKLVKNWGSGLDINNKALRGMV